MMHGHEKSDSVIVAVKPANKAVHPAAEQSAAEAFAAEPGGAKGGDQGKCGPANHALGTEPDQHATRAGPHTGSRKGKEEGEVHFALPPHQHRSPRGGVLPTRGGRGTGSGPAFIGISPR